MGSFNHGRRTSKMERKTSYLKPKPYLTSDEVVKYISPKIKIKNSNKNKFIFKKDVNGVFFAIYVLVRQQRHSPAPVKGGRSPSPGGDAKRPCTG